MPVSEIRYPQYRSYVDNRVQVNTAMMALLAGSRLAAHTLQLTQGSTATLSQLFPAVEHVERFNLRSDSARKFLHEADQHIASVAIPYALATHEEFVMQSLDFLTAEGRTLQRGKKKVQIKAWNMHEVLFATCSRKIPEESIQIFHVLREARNCIIHSGGRASTALDDTISAMDSPARHLWQGLNSNANPEDVSRNGQLTLTADHVITAFAITKRVGREINAALGSELAGESWARVAVKDFAATTTKTRNSSSWRRSMIGYARQYYAAASITENEIEQAARDTGVWTVAHWA